MPLPTGIPPAASHPTGHRPAGEGPPAALAAAPNAVSLLKSLRRCWLRAVVFGLVAGAIAAIAAWQLVPTPSHLARALLRVPPLGRDRALFPTAEIPPTLADHQRNQVALAKSRMVLSAACKGDPYSTPPRPGIGDLPMLQSKDNPVEWLAKQVQADFSVAPEILRIAIPGDDPEQILKVVTAIRDAYKEQILDKEARDRRERIETLKTQKLVYEERLGKLRTEERRLEQEGASKDAPTRGMMQMFANFELNWFEREYVRAESELDTAKIDRDVAAAAEKNLPTNVPPEAELQTLLAGDPVVAQSQHEVTALKAQIEQNAKAVQGPQGVAFIQRQRNSLADAEQKLAKLKKEMTPHVIEAWRTAQRAALENAISQSNARVALLEKTQKSLLARVDDLRAGIRKMEEKNKELDKGREERAQLESFVKAIGDEVQKREFERDALKPPPAILPDETIVVAAGEDKRVAMATAGTFLATFALVLAGFAFNEFRARRIGTVDEVVHGLGMNLIGAIPDSSIEASSQGVSGELSGHNTLAEAIDATRVMLLREARSQMLRVVMVTSAHSGEGKTSLSTHLAASLAQTGLRTLLIDGDLRNPIAHQVFELEVAPGFCELLRGEARPQDVIRETRIDRLSMIPAGRWSGGASRALAQDEIAGRIVRQFAAEYDYVIIDSSPVLPVVDPLLIGQLADGTIISVLRDVSRMPSVYAAHQRLAAGGVRVLGAVVSGVRGDAYGTAYPYRQKVGA